jgi:hypothetical protein
MILNHASLQIKIITYFKRDRNNNKISGVNLAVYNTIEPFSGRVMTQALNKDTGIKHDGTKMQ